jgi:Tol biopolymer transport system component
LTVRLRHLVAATVAVAAAVAALAPSGLARVVSVRTLLVSDPPGTERPDGPSANPALAGSGRVIVFDTAAMNFIPYDLNGSVRDVIAVDLVNGRQTVVSAGGDGPSSNPAVSADGGRIAFVSQASTFAPGDDNRASDIFVRDGTGPVALVSVAAQGGSANGPSSDPDVSPDGRYVVFTSSASNLVVNDRNAQPDVFLRDLVKRSIATNGRQQNKAVAAPYAQISDLSENGRYVVFDSDATSLAPRDANRRTDVFRRDQVTGRTRLISASSTNRQGDNDSFAPAFTPNGRFVAFQSFAGNLAPGDVPGEDVFIRDLRTRTTSIVNVPATGGRRTPELLKQLLRRPTISDSGTRVAFTSTAVNLVANDSNGFEGVFLRLLAPPRGRLVRGPRPSRRPTVVVAADDPESTHFLCRLDAGRPFFCPRGTVRLPSGLASGRHVLRARAGGPGMLYADALRVRIVVTRAR